MPSTHLDTARWFDSRWMSRPIAGLAALALLLSAAAPAMAKKKTPDDEREEVRAMVKTTLGKLYKLQPSARKQVESAPGHAVFSNFGMKILFAGGGSGKGLAVKSSTRQETFMKMVEIQAGLGMGVKKFSLVWVFETAAALDQFVHSGWEVGGQATAAAKAGEKGAAWAGAVSIAPGIWLYQMTESGLAAELTAKGTKYYADKDLNAVEKP